MPRERVLIVAKTKMGQDACVGAITVEGVSRRLLGGSGENQSYTTFYDVGDVWDIEYRLPEQSELEPPHVEDIHVTNQAHEKSNVPMQATLLKIISPWTGDITTIYDGLLQFTGGGSAYIDREHDVPDRSTWFWELDKPLVFEDSYYHYQQEIPKFKVKYVGYETPLAILKPKTLLRVSLARWRQFDDSRDPERCYLQLSGWFT